jgi:hypothetical protein
MTNTELATATRSMTGLREPLQNPLSALASHHQAGYFVQKTHQNTRYGSFFSLVSHPDG